ncbi:TIGR01459 family HAD-type hydrolase [uncultured Roseobacter sp.]|uniref:TIGR01459 family HAD-type hydrolase n=1 Tax=uncultured Roseobacter sp. TaxID=114847 RepID=UPI002623D725|nr:TIGR01459 family HAD-type hydrolase [uncultured Roseobacter sp.]
MSLAYDSLEHLFDQYDAFLIDQFGVLMSGSGPYPRADAALAALAARGKPVVVLSNSGKRSAPNCARLVRNGFDRAHFDTVLTSGEIAYEHLAAEIGHTVPHRARVLVLIKDGDTPPLAGLDVIRTDTPEAADLVLIVSRDPAKPIESYAPILARLADRNVPGICVNPDLKMLTSQGLIASAGQLGQMFQSLGGRLQWFGKPHPLIYDRAKERLGTVRSESVLCIGDSLQHDIAGGGAASFRTALVRTGVNAEVSDHDLERLIRSSKHTPDHFLSEFAI